MPHNLGGAEERAGSSPGRSNACNLSGSISPQLQTEPHGTNTLPFEPGDEWLRRASAADVAAAVGAVTRADQSKPGLRPTIDAMRSSLLLSLRALTASSSLSLGSPAAGGLCAAWRPASLTELVVPTSCSAPAVLCSARGFSGGASGGGGGGGRGRAVHCCGIQGLCRRLRTTMRTW